MASIATFTVARAGGALVLAALALWALTFWALALGRSDRASTPTSGADAPVPRTAPESPGDLYGRLTTYDGVTYEGPLRWGGGEEAFWGHSFNGVKDENRWAAYATADSENGGGAHVLGIRLPWSTRPAQSRRPFMARFGDIARIEARGDGVRGVLRDGAAFDPDIRVTLKSGTAFDLDRLSSSDFDDGVRVWDRHGVVDLGPREIRTIDLLSSPLPSDTANRLFGTVRTRQGAFTGFLQWDREASLGRDQLVGRTAGRTIGLPFGAVHSIARDPDGSARVTMHDGREIALTGTRAVGPGNRGVYVDDPRYGRVLVSWEAFERVDFSPAGRSPSYADFLPGRPLVGRVTTRAGRRLRGRLVFDLDESETTETLDAPSGGVDYLLPFGRVASIVLPAGARSAATVTLQSGEAVRLQRAGDLGDGNAGVLVFATGAARPEHVPWADVERIDLDRSPTTSPG